MDEMNNGKRRTTAIHSFDAVVLRQQHSAIMQFHVSRAECTASHTLICASSSYFICIFAVFNLFQRPDRECIAHQALFLIVKQVADVIDDFTQRKPATFRADTANKSIYGHLDVRFFRPFLQFPILVFLSSLFKCIFGARYAKTVHYINWSYGKHTRCIISFACFSFLANYCFAFLCCPSFCRSETI